MKVRARLMPVHVFVGGTATMLTMVSCATGVPVRVAQHPTSAHTSPDAPRTTPPPCGAILLHFMSVRGYQFKLYFVR